MQRLWTSRPSISRYLAVQQLKSRATNSLSSVQETFHATKDVFEKHKIVFTVSTSIASVAVAWTGYNIRRLHQSKVEKRLDSIEKAVSTPKSQIASFIATSGTTFIIGYLMGFRGGKRFATRKLRKEQMKMLGQMSKPKRFEFLRRSLIRRRSPESASESDTRPKKWQLGFLRRPRRLPETAPESLKKDVMLITIATPIMSIILKIEQSRGDSEEVGKKQKREKRKESENGGEILDLEEMGPKRKKKRKTEANQ